MFMGPVLSSLEQAEAKAERNSDLVHTLSQRERWAGIYEQAPSESAALGGYFGLAINCLSAALYMVREHSHLLHFHNGHAHHLGG